MALVKCLNCGKSISERAKSCPTCGNARSEDPQFKRSSSPNPFPSPFFERLPQWLMLALVTILLLGNGVVLAMFVFSDTKAGANSIAADTLREFKSSDGQISLTLSEDWIEDSGQIPGAIYFAENRPRDLAIVVFAEDKRLVRSNAPHLATDLDNYARTLRDLLVRELTGASAEPAIQTTIGGHAAVQAVLRGKMANIELAYFHTVVDTPTKYFQVRVFTTADRFPVERSELERIAASLQVHQ